MKFYRVSFKYLKKASNKWTAENDLGHKGGFATEQEADAWAKAQTDKTPLKLLVWDDALVCFTTVKAY